MPGEFSYHNAESELIDVIDDPPNEEGVWTMERRRLELFPPDDPRWPKTCACGYVFAGEDEWQVNIEHLYLDDAGREYTLHDNVPGMMWELPWFFDPKRDLEKLPEQLQWAREGKQILSVRYFEQHATKRPPLCVVVPGGDQWVIDSQASNGPGWTCEGEPPLLVCTPSIQTPRYHGFLGCNGAQPGWFT